MNPLPTANNAAGLDASRYEVLAGLAPADQQALLAAGERRRYPAGVDILREGETNDTILLVVDGEVAVVKGEPWPVQIATLRTGDCAGEISALEGARVSATLRSGTDVTLHLVALPTLPPPVRARVEMNLARVLAARLARSNDVIHRKHAEQLAATRRQLASAVYAAQMLLALSFYVLMVPVGEFLKPYLPTDSLISFFYIALFFGLAWTFITRVSEGFAAYGMTFTDLGRHIGRALAITAPVLGLAVAAKAAFLHAHPESGHRLFEPMGVLAAVPDAGWGLWLVFTAGYVVLAFAQEFVRVATQGSLASYFAAGGLSDGWKSIGVSSVVFGAMHVHLSWKFALIALASGLFWGWMYQRERSFWGVAVSHAVTGAWAVFVVGVPY